MSKFIQSLESRTFLSVTPTPTPLIPIPWPKPDATITADLKAVQAAESALVKQIKLDGPTIWKDEMALAAAIKAAYAKLPATLLAKLKTDEGTVATDFKKLFTDIQSKASAATIAADKAAIKTAEGVVASDEKTIHTDINTNPGVIAARAKLKTDSAAVNADEATLQAALKKLFTDLRNHA